MTGPVMTSAEANDIVESWSTKNRGWDRATLKAFGVSWPPPHGWKRDLVAKLVTGEIDIKPHR